MTEPWSLVLAAGEGSRLRALTTDSHGNAIPKQFCSVRRGPSLIRLALDRAGRVSPPVRTTAIVAAQHERWWRSELCFLPEHNILVQPHNRGTALGVLMPLLCVLDRDADARIVFIPSDHFVEDEEILKEAMSAAVSHVRRHGNDVVLLGIVPDEPDSQFGWIVPGEREASLVRPVQRFVEKPPAPIAAELMARGGMWNSFIFVSAARTVLDMFERRMPGVVATLLSALAHDRPDEALARVYERSDSYDFCRDVLQEHEGTLKVLPVAHCGWSDLGTPDRVRRCVTRLGEQAAPISWSASAPAAMDLAVALAGG